MLSILVVCQSFTSYDNYVSFFLKKKTGHKVPYTVQFGVNDHVDTRQREPQSDSTGVQELGRGLALLTQSPLQLYLTLLYICPLSFWISLHFSIWNKPLLFWYFGLSPPIFERDVFCRFVFGFLVSPPPLLPKVMLFLVIWHFLHLHIVFMNQLPHILSH